MHSLKSEKGNAIIGAVLIGGLALLGLQVMVSQVSNFSQELGKSEAAAKGGEELNTVLQVLTNKFRYHLVPNPNTVLGDNEGEDLTICDPAHPEQCKPEWAPDYSISPDSNMPPYIMSLLPSTTETPFVANKLVLGFKDTNGNCVKFDESEATTTGRQGRGKSRGRKNQLQPEDCEVVDLNVERGRVGALQSKTTLSRTHNIQNGFLGLPDLFALSPDEKRANFAKGFQFPLEKLSSHHIRFLEYLTASPSESASANPRAITRLLAEVNNTLVEIPIQPPPPPSACEISLKNPTQQPLDLSPGNVSVLFDVKANSIVQAANFHLGPDDGDLVGSFSMDQMDSQSVANFGQNVSLKADGFSLSLSNDDGDIQSPTNPNEAFRRISVTLVGLSSVPTDTQLVDGTPELRQTMTCATVFRIKRLAPPICSLIVTNSPTVKIKGDVAKLQLSCDSPQSGPVTSAVIAGQPVTYSYKRFKETKIISSTQNQIVCQLNPDPTFCSPTTMSKCTTRQKNAGYQNVKCFQTKDIYETITTTDLSLVTKPVFSGQYTRQTDGGAEVIKASASGPGGSTTVETSLGELCPYRDPDYTRQEFAYGTQFKDASGKDLDKIENAIADLIFTTGLINYTSHNTYWNSQSATASARNILTDKDGNWRGSSSGKNWDKPETCNGSNICMQIIQMSSAAYNNFKTGGKAYWVEVGPKTSASCSVIRTKMRHGGCFAGSTKLRMANGTEKLVSQIGENEWLYNPHYKAPVRVKSVVKGPENKPLFEVSYNDQKIVVTEDHPFLTRTGWVQAMELKAGSILIGAGTGLKVKKVRQLPYQKAEDVWNFELDTEDPMGHVVLANKIPTGDLITQQMLKKEKFKTP